MRWTIASLVIVTVLIGGCICPPPQLIHKNEPKKHIPGAGVNEIEEDVNKVTEDKKVDTEIDDLGLEYGRYLNEVVKVLDEDPEFAKKMENITHDQIISGEVARQIEMVAPEVRNRLDELKRVEMDRLRKLAMKEHKLEMEMESEHGNDGAYENDGRKWRTVNKNTGHVQIDAGHIDHQNPHTFEAEDLQKLILQATNDLEELDRKRRRDFKQYEMEKEIHYREGLQNMTAEQKHEAERKHDEEKRKHQQHGHINAPGSKHQFEEVWEEQDHMRKEDFNPQVFFQMHDITGDGFWDQEEVEAMLSGEVKKLYDDKDPHIDKNEMQEEFHRMREHIYKEIDHNHDGLISKKEFLDYSHSAEFQKDEGWKSVEEAPVYTEEELKQYEAHRQQLNDHYAKYGAYQMAYDPVQMAYHQAVMQGGATHNGQPVQYVMGQPQHVQNVQYHHVELPPQHNIHYVPQGQQQQQYHALPAPQQAGQPQIAGQAHPAQGGQFVPQNVPMQQQYHGQAPPPQQQYHGGPPPPQGQYQPAPGQYQPPPPQQYQQPPPPQQYGNQQANQHYQPPQQASQQNQQYQPPPPAGNQQQQQQHYQQPNAGQQQQYHAPPPPSPAQQQQRPK